MANSNVVKKSTDCEECVQLRKDFGVSESDLFEKKPPRMTGVGKVILGVFGASFVGVTAVCLPFVLPALRKVCLPYVPATEKQVQNVMTLLSGRSGTLVDLGSGDGRIVIEAARRGFQAEGIELNPWLVWYSRVAAMRAGVRGTARFRTRNLWKVDLGTYDNVVVFGVEQMMPQLERKLGGELRAGSMVVACRFPLKSWPALHKLDYGIDTVWVYSQRDAASDATASRAATDATKSHATSDTTAPHAASGATTPHALPPVDGTPSARRVSQLSAVRLETDLPLEREILLESEISARSS